MRINDLAERYWPATGGLRRILPGKAAGFAGRRARA